MESQIVGKRKKIELIIEKSVLPEKEKNKILHLYKYLTKTEQSELIDSIS